MEPCATFISHLMLRLDALVGSLSSPWMKKMPTKQSKLPTARTIWAESSLSVFHSPVDKRRLLDRVSYRVLWNSRIATTCAISHFTVRCISAWSALDSSSRTKLYVGNLSFYSTIDTIQDFFEHYGTVHDCYLPEDKETGGSRGFAFVTMDAEGAAAAIEEADGYELDGRIIRVNEAQPKGNSRGVSRDDYDDNRSGGGYDDFNSGSEY